MGKPKPNPSKKGLKERVEDNPVMVVLAALLLILGILGYFSGAFDKILVLYTNISTIPEIKEQNKDLSKKADDLKKEIEQKYILKDVANGTIKRFDDADKKMSDEIAQLRDKLFDSLIERTYGIESKNFFKEAEEFLRMWPPPWERGKMGALREKPDSDFNKLNETYRMMKDNYQTFLEKNPEKLKEIDDTFEVVKNRYNALKSEELKHRARP